MATMSSIRGIRFVISWTNDASSDFLTDISRRNPLPCNRGRG